MKKENKMIETALIGMCVVILGYYGLNKFFPNEADRLEARAVEIKQPTPINSFAVDLKKLSDKYESLEKIKLQNDEILVMQDKRISELTTQLEFLKSRSTAHDERLGAIKSSLGIMNGVLNRVASTEKQPITIKFEGVLPIDVKAVPPLQRATPPTVPVIPPKDMKKLNAVKDHPLFTQSTETK